MIGAIIQARMGSTRLPRKILKEIAGKPMLWHVVNRVKHAKKVDKVIVATTAQKEDDVIEELAEREGWDYFRGSEDNVLDRYYQAAKQFSIDTIVRVTADCPLIDFEIIDGCIEEFQKKKCDYMSNPILTDRTGALPRGIDDIEIFSFKTIETAYKNAVDDFEKEHVTPYIWRNAAMEFNIGNYARIKHEYARPYRLTVDYLQDFEVIKAIYDNLYQNNPFFVTEQIIAFLDTHQKLAFLNSDQAQMWGYGKTQ